ERRRAEARDPWHFFKDIGAAQWTEIPDEFRRLVMEHVTTPVIDEAYWDGDEHSPYLCRATIDGEAVAWIGEGESIVDGPYLVTARENETYRALGDKLWRRLGSAQLLYGPAGLVTDPFTGSSVLATAQMTELAARMRRFLD